MPEDGIIDVFTAAGLKRPDILDDRLLAEVRGLKHKNVAAELLERLLKTRSRFDPRRTLSRASSSARNINHAAGEA